MSKEMRGLSDVEMLRLLRNRRAVDGLDYLRLLRRLSASMSQIGIARELGLTQPSISSALKTAVNVADVREGFSGANPYEIVQRYAAGELGYDQMVDELSRWEYVPIPEADGYDWLTEDPDGTFEEVGKALDEGLIDSETYEWIEGRLICGDAGQHGLRRGCAAASESAQA